METQEKTFDLKEFKRTLSARIEAQIKAKQARLAELLEEQQREARLQELEAEGKSQYSD
jgi:hypothetical protein